MLTAEWCCVASRQPALQKWHGHFILGTYLLFIRRKTFPGTFWKAQNHLSSAFSDMSWEPRTRVGGGPSYLCPTLFTAADGYNPSADSQTIFSLHLCPTPSATPTDVEFHPGLSQSARAWARCACSAHVGFVQQKMLRFRFALWIMYRIKHYIL